MQSPLFILAALPFRVSFFFALQFSPSMSFSPSREVVELKRIGSIRLHLYEPIRRLYFPFHCNLHPHRGDRAVTRWLDLSAPAAPCMYYASLAMSISYFVFTAISTPAEGTLSKLIGHILILILPSLRARKPRPGKR